MLICYLLLFSQDLGCDEQMEVETGEQDSGRERDKVDREVMNGAFV